MRTGGKLRRFLDEIVGEGVLSAVTALVGSAAGVEWSGAAGLVRSGPPGRPAAAGTRYDVASITKPFVATLALALDGDGRLPLAAPLGDLLPRADCRLARCPLSDLLRHRAELLAWIPLYGGEAPCRSLDEVVDRLAGGALLGAPAGTYSDFGYVLWGLLAERQLGQPLGDLLADLVLGPLGLRGTAPEPGDRPEVAESRMGTGKEVAFAAALGLALDDLGPPPVGHAQDGNARLLAALGARPPGHSGLFAPARDLWALGVEWLRPGRLLQEEAVARALAGGGPFALGWWRRRAGRGGGGRALSRRSFGATGFAGGNLWVDPERDRVLVLLGHRIDPASDLNAWRRRFHALALDT